jgi:hypothetical protein
MRPRRRWGTGRSLLLPPEALRSTGTSARRTELSGPQPRSDQLHATRSVDGMVRLVRLLANVRMGRQNAPSELRKSGTGFRRKAVRRPGSGRDLLLDQSAVPGQHSGRHRRSMVRLESVERVHSFVRRRNPLPEATMRQSCTAGNFFFKIHPKQNN